MYFHRTERMIFRGSNFAPLIMLREVGVHRLLRLVNKLPWHMFLLCFLPMARLLISWSHEKSAFLDPSNLAMLSAVISEPSLRREFEFSQSISVPVTPWNRLYWRGRFFLF